MPFQAQFRIWIVTSNQGDVRSSFYYDFFNTIHLNIVPFAESKKEKWSQTNMHFILISLNKKDAKIRYHRW